ncbi:MAG: chromosome segregation protein SMC [Clostridia bacterium]|nr:chromosome segregation protein SMC [Clostridia bacterium]
MRLTKLELYGFKSFAKKTEIQFDKGITAIVGPNGSGKSNIADSIRWVLGEQSAKALRGSKMEDVIFGGTALRRAMSYCEVTLTFDNSDGQLPVDFSEVCITRRVYRSGESEYCINKNTCRLRDLQELFRDTGLGKEGYSIVGQGKVEEILSNKSGERRKAFEEAAGIMKYRVRKEEAERNLDNTGKNLTRLGDIISEIEERIEPLSEQAETASLYLKLRDELKELEISLFLYQYDKVRERIAGIDSTIEQILREIEETDKLRSEIAAKCADIEERERKTGDELAQKNAKLVELTGSLEEQLGNIRVLNERIQGAHREHEALQARIAENEKRYNELCALLSSQDTRTDERESMLEQLRREHEEKGAELAELSKAVSDKEAEIEDLKTSMFEAANRLGDAKSNISRLTATLESLRKRLSEMESDTCDITGEEEKLSVEEKEAEEELRDTEKIADELKRKMDSTMQSANESTVRRKQTDEEIRKTEQLLEHKRARLTALMDMKKAHDGYYASIQKLMADAAHDSWLQSMIEGTVAELIQVPKEYEIALEMAMGATLQNIVTPDEDAAKQVVRYLRENRYGRATFLPVTTMRPRTVTPDERRKMERMQGYIGIASELISYLPKYSGVVENLLGRTIIVDDLDTGVEINRATAQSMRIATLDGDIINPGGSITGGSIGKNLNLLGRERECADLLAEIDTLKKKLAGTLAQKTELEKEISSLSANLSSLSAKVHETDILLAKQRDKLDIIVRQAEQMQHRHEQAEQERMRICESISDMEDALAQAESERETLAGSSTTTQSDIVAAQSVLMKMRAEHAEKSDAVTDVKMRIVALEKEADALASERRRLEQDAENLRKSIEADKAREANFSSEYESVAEQKRILEAETEQKRSANTELYDACKRLEEYRASLLDSLDSARGEKEKADEQAENLRERKHRQEISKSRSESELCTMQDRIWTEYELTYENAQVYRKSLPITASTQRVTEIKREIRDLGDINVNAIAEYRALNERYTAICTQCDDLRKAEEDLKTLISELTKLMETNFREKFEQIRENFKRVFSELFGGGTAELILSDESDILNCDIDILAQIPGKKLQSLSPLSGGERTLTAIALQFAILALKPTAFCLLDEIDASLDEVNVTRFADYVQDYAQSTQFILITHRKGSMESCNAIYGVAQEEKGVSKVVSARLTRKDQQ